MDACDFIVNFVCLFAFNSSIVYSFHLAKSVESMKLVGKSANFSARKSACGTIVNIKANWNKNQGPLYRFENFMWKMRPGTWQKFACLLWKWNEEKKLFILFHFFFSSTFIYQNGTKSFTFCSCPGQKITLS